MKEHLAFSTLLEIEDDVANIARWAELISLLGSSPHMIEPGVLHAISHPLTELGRRVDQRWKEAVKATWG